MRKPTEGRRAERVPLSRERVLLAAVSVADAGGVAKLTIRSLAHELGVKPMAVYHHVANKSAILDGIVDLVFEEIDLPPRTGDWQNEIRQGATSTRQALRRHPWALGLLESRKNPGSATLRHHDRMIGTLRRAGFSVEATAHAYALLDSYVYGFALQEATLPFDSPQTAAEIAQQGTVDFPAREYPHLFEMATEFTLQPGYDFGDEFQVGLDVILAALTRSIPVASGRTAPLARTRLSRP